mmetsp:Transcript_18313/g.25462  ORF Transcript_18313/g.25462 Transcript_18313/m.25462 type:complete len:250 (+) Transcript_18313:331-1080(+)
MSCLRISVFANVALSIVFVILMLSSSGPVNQYPRDLSVGLSAVRSPARIASRSVSCRSSQSLPYGAEQNGISDALEKAMRKRDTVAVHMLQRARNEQLEAQMQQREKPRAPQQTSPRQSQPRQSPPAANQMASSGVRLPYGANERGIDEALEVALRKRDIRAVRTLEKAKSEGIPQQQAPSQPPKAQSQSPQPSKQAPQKSGANLGGGVSAIFSTDGPLPYDADNRGIGDAIELAMRKKDTRAVRVLER